LIASPKPDVVHREASRCEGLLPTSETLNRLRRDRIYHRLLMPHLVIRDVSLDDFVESVGMRIIRCAHEVGS
jgi:hypothetical protein